MNTLKQLVASSTAAAVMALPALTSVAHAGETRWVSSVTVPASSTALFIGKCGFFGCPAGKPVTGSVAVGQTIQGMKVGAIRCEKQTKTIPGFRGGPKFVAIAGTWNCMASTSRTAVNNTPGPNGERPYPWISVIGAQI